MLSLNKKIAVIGAGYWGKNLVRNFSEMGILYTICDTDSQLLENISKDYNVPITFSEPKNAIKCPEIDAVVIATPAATHYELAKAAMENGKDVFVEKPLALEYSQAEELAQMAESKDLTLMVDHLLQYHPAVIKLKKLKIY